MKKKSLHNLFFVRRLPNFFTFKSERETLYLVGKDIKKFMCNLLIKLFRVTKCKRKRINNLKTIVRYRYSNVLNITLESFEENLNNGGNTVSEPRFLKYKDNRKNSFLFREKIINNRVVEINNEAYHYNTVRHKFFKYRRKTVHLPIRKRKLRNFLVRI